MAVPTKPILILEDELLIAMDLQLMIEEAGFTESTIVSSCADASVWLEEHTPSLAIIETRLRDGAPAAIVKSLVEKAIPFIVSSGAARDSVDPIFHHGAWIGKPCRVEMLKATMQTMLA